MLYFDGRKDGICNVNGRKVLAVKIENELLRCPGIAEAAVKTVQKRPQDILAAWIVPDGKLKLDFVQIRTYLSAQLSNWEIPKALICIEKLPKNESGKILKRKLEYKKDGTV